MPEENVRTSHFYTWSDLPSRMIPLLMEEFLWNGVKYLSLDSSDCKKMLEDPAFITSIFWYAHQTGIVFADVHAPWSVDFDLDVLAPRRRKEMIREHTFLLDHLGKYGIKTYTMHIGASPWCATPQVVDLPEIRKNTLDTLEQLLPAAEKNGIIIAVENSFEPVDSADEVLFYVEHFSHPNIRCCFDSGHANIMRKEGKEMEKYQSSFREIVWKNDLVLSDSEFEKLSPYIVTCHLHDNDGYNDSHTLPGTGTTNWNILMEDLAKKCPSLQSIQNESSFSKKNCIGKSAAVFRILTSPVPDKNEALKIFLNDL